MADFLYNQSFLFVGPSASFHLFFITSLTLLTKVFFFFDFQNLNRHLIFFNSATLFHICHIVRNYREYYDNIILGLLL